MKDDPLRNIGLSASPNPLPRKAPEKHELDMAGRAVMHAISARLPFAEICENYKRKTGLGVSTASAMLDNLASFICRTSLLRFQCDGAGGAAAISVGDGAAGMVARVASSLVSPAYSVIRGDLWGGAFPPARWLVSYGWLWASDAFFHITFLTQFRAIVMNFPPPWQNTVCHAARALSAVLTIPLTSLCVRATAWSAAAFSAGSGPGTGGSAWSPRWLLRYAGGFVCTSVLFKVGWSVMQDLTAIACATRMQPGMQTALRRVCERVGLLKGRPQSEEVDLPSLHETYMPALLIALLCDVATTAALYPLQLAMVRSHAAVVEALAEGGAPVAPALWDVLAGIFTPSSLLGIFKAAAPFFAIEFATDFRFLLVWLGVLQRGGVLFGTSAVLNGVVGVIDRFHETEKEEAEDREREGGGEGTAPVAPA